MVYQIGLDQIKVWKIFLWLTTCCPKKVMGVCLLEKAHTISALRDFGETCTMGFLYIFYNLFYHMEDLGILDSLNPLHLAVLHYLFCSEINRKLAFWSDAWARHRLRTVKSTPLILWTSGQLQNPVGLDEHENMQNYGVEGFVDEFIVEEGRPIFESLSTMISQECQNALEQEFHRDCQSNGIADFQRCLDIVERYT